MSEIRLANVSKRFGEIEAISNLDLTIKDGEFVVLLGPTGAGKTTTLRLVAGLERPKSGQVFMDGIDVTGLDASKRDVTFVFQQYSLYPHYSVFDNMAFPLRAPGRKMPEDHIKKRVGEVAEMLRISEKLQNKATQLSGGEMQRVSIGRALVRSPRIFLMDEPLSSLDAKLREDLRLELKRIQQELGATVLYVTHDQLEAMTLADRIGILDEGRVVQVGSPRDVYERPANKYAARRLGTPQINLINPGELGLKPLSDKAAAIGIRPEDIAISQTKGTKGKVLTIEHLGVESVVLLDINGKHIHGLLSPSNLIEEGADVFVSANPVKMIEFDAAGNAV
jgi:multiple sugar transport system ATP-binding protein